jgi:hypothetical protein
MRKAITARKRTRPSVRPRERMRVSLLEVEWLVEGSEEAVLVEETVEVGRAVEAVMVALGADPGLGGGEVSKRFRRLRFVNLIEVVNSEGERTCQSRA